MTDIIRKVTFDRVKKNDSIPDIKSGDTVGVHVRIKEGDKERVQLFKGVVIKVQGSGMGRSFTVRKLSDGVGVERTFPFASPFIDKVDLVARGKRIRRSRLFYLRNLKGRAARLASDLIRPESTKKTTGDSKKADSKKAEPKAEAPKADAKAAAPKKAAEQKATPKAEAKAPAADAPAPEANKDKASDEK